MAAPAPRMVALAAVIIGCLPGGSAAQPAPILDEGAAVQRAMAHNPTLRAAMLDLASAVAAERAADALYGTSFVASVSGTHAEQPVATLGGVTPTTTDALDLSAGVTHALPIGTTLGVEVDGSVDRRKLNPTPATPTAIELGPDYRLEVRATFDQPLLRGAWLDAGEAELREARFRRAAARHGRDRAASELLRDVLLGYRELWYATEALEVQRRARDFARDQEHDAQERAELGLLAPADVLSFSTNLASLEEAVALAESERRRRAISLAVLIGLEPVEGGRLTASAQPPPFSSADVTLEEHVRTAMRASSEVRQLAADAALARDRVRQADNAALTRLDLSAWASLRGLGDRDAVAPFEQVGRLSAISAFAALELELPFDNTARTEAAVRARIDADAADARLRAARDGVAGSVASQVETLHAARRRVELADRTVSLARDLATAEQQRFELGTSTPLAVLSAQESQRQARLRLLRARTDLDEAAVELSQLEGTLLPRYAEQMGETER